MRRTPLIAVFALALLQAGCADSRTPTNPRAPSDVANADRTVDGQSGKVVSIFDACDPTTFAQNGVSCTRSGGVRFDQFLSLVTANSTPGGWHFAPAELTVKVGQGFFAQNRGGEVHTFTEVDHFGGGIIQGLNVLSGNPVEAEACKHLTGADFLQPGATSDLDIADDEGTELYQCCIHPWMRTVVHKKG